MVSFSLVLADELFSLSHAMEQDHISTLKHFQTPSFRTFPQQESHTQVIPG